ncbi:LicD family protein [Arcanobacterium pinnipediorum]|uniref:LicD family protein n=1 Tax=Arcanobacterium pinnipediorum TaxID=1503041 RepID=A0ABY5AIA8_9ACTO|nr:LicD family protein [Arcanobacterium pinnipediorum]USR79466.1 LicD family protein [Arcanobacterium pinnipediorum]
MTDTYDPQTLKRIQRSMRDVLREFDRVCLELGLRYVVYGGSAIGAVRHGGFIPWDDDVDICMLREDYEKFFNEAPGLLDSRYVLIDSRTDPAYPKTFGVLGLRDSEFTPGVAHKREYRMPLGIDLFPLDRIPRTAHDFSKQSKQTWLWGRLLYLRGTPNAVLSLPRPIQLAVTTALHTIHWTLKLSRVTPRTLVRQWEQAARRFDDDDSDLFGDFSTRDPKRWSATVAELFPAKRVPFDGIEVMLAHDYDAILTRGYGDYMRIPPEHERENHAASAVVFGPYAPQ